MSVKNWKMSQFENEIIDPQTPKIPLHTGRQHSNSLCQTGHLWSPRKLVKLERPRRQRSTRAPVCNVRPFVAATTQAPICIFDKTHNYKIWNIFNFTITFCKNYDDWKNRTRLLVFDVVGLAMGRPYCYCIDSRHDTNSDMTLSIIMNPSTNNWPLNCESCPTRT